MIFILQNFRIRFITILQIMVNKFLSVAMLLACLQTTAQEFPRKYEAMKISEPPVIDGKLERTNGRILAMV
jgi:hypothetical protein